MRNRGGGNLVRRGLATFVLASSVLGCRSAGDDASAALTAEIEKLERDRDALVAMLARAEKGELVNSRNIVFAIHADVVGDILSAGMPIEQVIDGRIGLRLETVMVKFDGGFGTVEVEGRAWLERRRSIAVTFRAAGGFSNARLDPDTGALTCGVGLDGLEVETVPGGWLDRWLGGSVLLAWMNQKGRQEIAEQLSPLEIPLVLDRRVVLPDIDTEAVAIRGATLPVKLAVAGILAKEDRLWIVLEPEIGEWERELPKPATGKAAGR